MTKLLIVIEQKGIRNALTERLKYEGFEVASAQNVEETSLLSLKETFDILVWSVKGVHNQIYEQLEILRRNFPHSAIIALGEGDNIKQAVECVRLGAYDYISQPIDQNDLMSTIKGAAVQAFQNRATINNKENITIETSQDEIEHNEEESVKSTYNDDKEIFTELEGGDFAASPGASKGIKAEEAHVLGIVSRIKVTSTDDMVGESKAIEAVKRLIDKVAKSDARVLVTGANGTGKELVARWLHNKSNRKSGPFIEVNCAAIPSELIESELFGHEKGAFTSAIKQRKGKFEQADGGTLFLDEIGDMSLSAQAKVLRALQENRISRVGSDKDIMVNVRVVAATNKDLSREIAKSAFREDLYHRLSVIVIRVPMLSERREDIPLLINHFVKKVSAEYGIKPKNIESLAMEQLYTMPWTGNIRELKNVIERLILLSDEVITKEDVEMYGVDCF